MVRNQPQPEADRKEILECVHQNCPYCNKLMRNKYDNYRKRENIGRGGASTAKNPSLL